jgi:hypothetical protein
MLTILWCILVGQICAVGDMSSACQLVEHPGQYKYKLKPGVPLILCTVVRLKC